MYVCMYVSRGVGGVGEREGGRERVKRFVEKRVVREEEEEEEEEDATWAR